MVLPSDAVWREGMANWAPVGAVPEFAEWLKLPGWQERRLTVEPIRHSAPPPSPVFRPAPPPDPAAPHQASNGDVGRAVAGLAMAVIWLIAAVAGVTAASWVFYMVSAAGFSTWWYLSPGVAGFGVFYSIVSINEYIKKRN